MKRLLILAALWLTACAPIGTHFAAGMSAEGNVRTVHTISHVRVLAPMATGRVTR